MTKGAKLLEKEVVKDTGGKVSFSINLIELQNRTIRHSYSNTVAIDTKY